MSQDSHVMWCLLRLSRNLTWNVKKKKKLEVYKCPEKEKPDCSSGYNEDFAMFMFTRTFQESFLAQLGRDV